MKILFVYDEYFPPEKGYTAPYKYAIELSKLNCEVLVLCGRRENEESFELINGITVLRCTEIFDWERRQDRMYLIKAFMININLIRSVDIVHMCYIFVSPIFNIIFRIFGLKCIIDIRSVPLKSNILGKIMRNISSFLSNGVAVIDIALVDKLSIRKKDIFVFPLGSDVVNDNAIRKKNSHDIVRFVSVGSIDMIRNQKIIVRAAKIGLLDHGIRDFEIVFIGGGNASVELYNEIEEQDMSEYFHILGYLDHNIVVQKLLDSDCGICYLPIEIYNHQPPTKIYEYIAANLPFIATNTSATRNICKFINKSTYILAEDSVEAFSEGMLSAYKKFKLEWKHLAEIHQSETLKNFEWEKIIKDNVMPAYLKIINQ